MFVREPSGFKGECGVPEAALEEHTGMKGSGHLWFLSGSSVLPVTVATGFTEGYFRQELSGLV